MAGGSTRSAPPSSIFDLEVGDQFIPAPEIIEWARATFIDEGATLENSEHVHLRPAHIGALWTNVENAKRGLRVIGMAEPGMPQGAMGRWSKARAERQVVDWFGIVPDFLITLDAHWWMQASDAEACALVEHELYHCAQQVDDFGAPRFNKQTGRPVFGMRGHDVEQFVGVVRRYGAGASGVQAMVDAANAPPEIAEVKIAQACGTCRLRVA
jgi:hypothetical protein